MKLKAFYPHYYSSNNNHSMFIAEELNNKRYFVCINDRKIRYSFDEVMNTNAWLKIHWSGFANQDWMDAYDYDFFETVEGHIYEIILRDDKWKGRYIHNNVTFNLCKAIVKYSKYIGNRLENPEILENINNKK